MTKINILQCAVMWYSLILSKEYNENLHRPWMIIFIFLARVLDFFFRKVSD